MKTHFVFAGYYWNDDKLISFMLKGMKQYKIKKVMVTIISMWRLRLITKEATEKYYKGEKFEKVSVNDDLESLFEDLRLGKQPQGGAYIYFLPKLTEKEMELVEKENTSYFKTFSWWNPDVEEAEMKLSESDSKFVEALGIRKTFTIENSSEKNISTD